ncbi:aminoglycoside phosphotransferase family protein [Rummeliibacillus pycnus]|uniref:aminoglycoside phosphotransferase family protein n=1 Tax=Rummeliibacillus pycnus TaxID=101070 RepID=UPI0037C8D182
MEDTILLLQDRIKFLHNVTNIEKLTKGYSPDKKYLIVDQHRQKYILRISAIKNYERKKTEFQILKEIQKYMIKSPLPIDIGFYGDLGICYTIHSYIEGEDAKEAMPTLSTQDQFNIGIAAGSELSRMHLHPAPTNIKHWYERAMQKHYRYLDEYKKCGIKIDGADKVMNFIDNNANILRTRPNRFQHDDFHLENIILKDKEYVGVIDFNNFDWGDPLHDFVKVAMFTREESVSYSIGQIQGYFNHNVPEDFWRLYVVYVAMVIFSSVVWSIKYSPKQLDQMLERIDVVLEDHKNFELLKPTWYR